MLMTEREKEDYFENDLDYPSVPDYSSLEEPDTSQNYFPRDYDENYEPETTTTKYGGENLVRMYFF